MLGAGGSVRRPWRCRLRYARRTLGVGQHPILRLRRARFAGPASRATGGRVLELVSVYRLRW